MHPVDRSGRRTAMPLAAAAAVLLLGGAAPAPSLDDTVDEEEFLRGLRELGLREVAERYLATHPPRDPVDAARHHIELQRMLLADDRLHRDERVATIERVLALRAQLISDHAADTRRASWLLDQAADRWFHEWTIDGCGLATLFGLPAPEQRERAARVAEQLMALASEAEIALDDAILALEQSPGFADSVVLRSQRRRLDENERRRRLPFFQGIAACVRAELGEIHDDQRRDLRTEAVDLLAPLGDVLEGRLRVQARCHAGLAAARLGRFDEAETMLRDAATDEAAAPADIFVARMSAVVNRLVRGGTESGLAAIDSIEPRYDQPSDVFFRILLADQRFLLRSRLAEAVAGAARSAAMDRAFAAYGDLLAIDLGLEAREQRSLIVARLNAAADLESSDAEALPALAQAARAARLAASPTTRRDGLAALRLLLDRGDLDDTTESLLMLELAEALRVDGRLLDAAQLLAEFASIHATHREAAAGRAEAAELALAEYRQRGREPRARAVLDQCLDALLKASVASASSDRWSLIAAELAVADNRLDDAARTLHSIASTSESWIEAQVQLVLVERAQSLAPTGHGSDPARLDGLLRSVARVQAIIDERLGGSVTAPAAAALSAARLRLDLVRAEALIARGTPEEAASLLDAVDRAASLPTSLRGEALRIRLEASRVAGRADDMQRDLERFLQSAAAADAQPVLISLLESASEEVVRLTLDDRLDEAADRARRDLAPLAIIIDDWLRSAAGPSSRQPRLQQRVADAFRFAEQWQLSLSRYESLLIDHPDQLELLFGRAECLYGLGAERSAEAMAIYKRLSAARRGAADEYYWQSQLRMLQILDRMNEGTDQIAGQVARLKQQDSALGGPRFARQLNALLMKHEHR